MTFTKNHMIFMALFYNFFVANYHDYNRYCLKSIISNKKIVCSIDLVTFM